MTAHGTGPVELSDLDWLLARAACAEATAASAAWRDWLSVADIDSVPDHAHPFLVALGARADGGLPADEAGRLRGLHRRSWYVNQRLSALAAATVEVLAAAGVPTILFGPLSTALRAGGEPGWRHVTGVDLLLRRNDLAVASTALLRQGLCVARAARRRATSVLGLVDPQGNTVRLHRVLPHLGALAAADDSVWQRSTRLTVSGREIVALSTHDALVLAASPRLGSDADDAVWPLDVHHLAGAVALADRWAEVVIAANGTPWGPSVADALGECQARLGTVVPDDLLAQLARLPGPSPTVRLERRARRRRAQLRRAVGRSAASPDGA